MDRILRDSGGTLQLLTYDATGALADVDGTTNPTIAVTDSGGNAVAGFTATRLSAGTYQATVPGNLEQLDTYDVGWTWANGQSRRSRFEIVGTFLFEIADLRAYDGTFTDATAYPAAAIRSVREEVVDKFASPQAAGASFILRGRRERIDGTGEAALILAEFDVRTLVAAWVDGVAFTVAELADVVVHPFGMLERKSSTWPAGLRNVEVLYEYGFASVPGPVHRAGLRYAKHLLLTNALDATSERATAVFNELGGYRLTLAGRDGPTGLPEVDAVLREFGHARIGAR